MKRGGLTRGSEDQPRGGRKGSLEQRGKRSPRNGEYKAGLTSILVVLMQAGDVRAPHKEDGIDGDGLGASRVPRGHQWYLEVDPGLAQTDEADDYQAGQAQR